MFCTIVFLATLAVASVCATSRPEFSLPTPTPRQVTLFDIEQPIERGGGQSFDDNWPWGGLEVSSWSGLYPVFLAANQALDAGIPIAPWTSWVSAWKRSPA